MNIKFSGEYKAISPFEWNDIPKLAIISGLNGSGKSQLLRLISGYFYYKQKKIKPDSNLFNISTQGIEEIEHFSDKLIIEKINYEFGEVTSWNQYGKLTNIEQFEFHFSDFLRLVSEIYYLIDPNERQESLRAAQNQLFTSSKGSFSFISTWTNLQPYNSISKGFQFINPDIIINEIVNRSGKERINLTLDDIQLFFPEELLLRDKDIILQDRLEMLFFIFQFKKNLRIKIGLTTENYYSAPWEILNQILRESQLPYKFSNPTMDVNFNEIVNDFFKGQHSKPYKPQLIHSETNKVIGMQNLSSGERIIISLALLLYYSNERGRYRKLMILDEPDAFLHPSMTKQFFNVIYDTLVKKYDVRVIMTTHSPSTIALAPENEDCQIFELKKEPTLIELAPDKSKIISHLSSGLIIVTKATKFVIVEGTDDKPFYEAVYDLLKSNKQLNHEVNIVFIPGKNKDSVEHWANVTRENDFLNKNFQGIIDKDYGNQTDNDAVHIIERYSIENYLLDPIIVYSLYINRNDMPESLKKFNIKEGEEGLINKLDESDLQKMNDFILNIIEPNLENLKDDEKEIISVEYLNGIKINFPKWFLFRRGKDLRNTFQKCLPGANLINNNNLRENFKRINLVPKDLLTLFQKIQKFG